MYQLVNFSMEREIHYMDKNDSKYFRTNYIMQLSLLLLEQKMIMDMKNGKKMLNLVREQDGFLGVESAREDIGITVSY